MRMALTLTMAMFGGCLAGCALNTEPIERQANQLVIEVIKPAVMKAAEELGTQTAQLQGQVSAINPGYEVTFEGMWCTGIKGRFDMRAVGISGNLAGATQAARPAKLEPETVVE